MASTDPAFADAPESPKKLDDMWQRQQTKTFTAWVNSHLRKRNLNVGEVHKDLSDGTLLMQLLEIISDETLPRPARGKMRIHKVENVGKALAFVNDKGVDVRSIGPEEIVDENLKMVLGLVWMLILRFEIQDISEEHMNAKDALLLWCQRKTEPYSNIDIQNFHMSWKDGLAFCGLIHRHRPDLIDYDSLSKSNPRQNFELAFSVAEKELDIPPMLDVDDMVECVKPDERSIMTYVAAFYKAFANSNTTEIAAKKISTVLKTNREHERLIAEYQTMATNLLAWIAEKTAWLQSRQDLHQVTECQGCLDEMNSFRSDEIPVKLGERGALEEHYRTLQTKLRLSGRPPFVASEGQEIVDIANAWTGLDAADQDRFNWVLDELKRIRLAETKAQLFGSKATAHEAWTNGLVEQLSTDDYSSQNLAGVQALQKKHEAFESDFRAHESRVHEIGTLANELDELRYVQADGVNDRYATIYENWQQLVALTQDRTTKLGEALQRQQHLDELYIEFAKQAPPFSNFLELAKGKLTEPYVVDTETEVVAIQEQHEAFKTELPKYQEAYDLISKLQASMAELGASSSPYSNHSFESLEAKWQEVQQLIGERDGSLNTEATTQADREALRIKWAEAAQATDSWMTEQDAAVAAASQAASLDQLEAQINALAAMKQSIEAYQSTFDELEKIHAANREALVFQNSHTTITIEGLRGRYQALKSGISRTINEFENQILARDATNVSPEQMKEIEDSFKHWDKDGSGQLEYKEFRAFLLSLGYNIPQVAAEGEDDMEFKRIVTRVDPNGDGVVSLDEFIAFTAEENADAESAEQLLEAFGAMSKGQPYVLAADLQRELEPELAEYCIKLMSPYEGGPEGALDFASFANALYGESDL
eukprot:m.352167 g.352167  ORF g.352167 m.352167 type:complete len:881 (+) comp16460_c0_seq1:2559-5201(+)